MHMLFGKAVGLVKMRPTIILGRMEERVMGRRENKTINKQRKSHQAQIMTYQ